MIQIDLDYFEQQDPDNPFLQVIYSDNNGKQLFAASSQEEFYFFKQHYERILHDFDRWILTTKSPFQMALNDYSEINFDSDFPSLIVDESKLKVSISDVRRIERSLESEEDFDKLNLNTADELTDFFSDNHMEIVYFAWKQFWSTADPDDTSTHNIDNGDISKWLINEHGVSANLATTIPTLIRPVWAKKGRKPSN